MDISQMDLNMGKIGFAHTLPNDRLKHSSELLVACSTLFELSFYFIYHYHIFFYFSSWEAREAERERRGPGCGR
jgi:hypothetical protein